MRSPLPLSLLGGFTAAAVADVAAVASIHAPRASSTGVVALEALYAMGHLLFVGLIAAGCAAAGSLVERKVPHASWRRFASAVAAGLVGVAAGRFLLAVDLSVFEAPLRIAAFAAAGVPFAALFALRGVGARALWFAALHIVAGLAAVVAHPYLLEESYVGLHVFANVAGGVSIGFGIERIVRRLEGTRVAAKIARTPRAIGYALLAVTAGWAWAAVAIPPSNAVRMSLVRRPGPTLLAFLPRASTASFHGRIREDEVAWFADRTSAPTIPPTKPPLTREAPIVILLTIDAFRADALDNEALPRLRKLAAEGARFTMARSPASATSPSIGALLTGKYYSSLFWTARSIGGKVKFFLPDDDSPRFAELLSSASVATKLVNTGRGFLPEYGLTRGFAEVSPAVKWAEEAMPLFDQWLVADAGPTFVFGHLMDAHAPYDKVKKSGSTKEKWLAELATVDAVIGRIEDLVTSRGLWPRTYLVVSADHGEAFGEHNTTNHASTIYEELVRIPLVVRGPGIAPGTRVDEPVSLIDMGPTILDLFQVDTPGRYMGQSLVPLLGGRDGATLTRPIALDTGRRLQALVDRDGLKVMRNVRAGTFEAYDLIADPGEKENLYGKRDLTDAFGRLTEFFERQELVKPGYEIPFRD